MYWLNNFFRISFNFEKDRALQRRFQKIDVAEPSIDEAYKIMFGLKGKYEEYHKVKYSDEAVKASVDYHQNILEIKASR